MKIRLERVRYMPKTLQQGVLYVSEEFGTAAHLCACGCGSKIRTPLGPTDWAIEESQSGPTLRPSVGNWQQACESHYWIWRGDIRWAEKWTPHEIAAGRRGEQRRREAYYDALYRDKPNLLLRIWRWLKSLLNQ